MIANNFIVQQHARQYHWSGDCFLSIKSFYNGSAKYHVKQREYNVNENNYLVLNDCTRYNLTIDSVFPIESFCVFFTPEFVSQVVSELNSTEDQLLDFSIRRTEGLKLLERNYLHGSPVSRILVRGRRIFRLNMSELEKEDFYCSLLQAIIFQDFESLKEMDRLSAKKKSTKEEIHRRLYYAKDFIDCNYSGNLTLKKISQVAMLSENHLLRNFVRVFNISPFQYITQLKIREAKRQIVETDENITHIATALGYSSLGNFSYYFKNVTGMSPIGLRKKVKRSK